LINDHCYEIVRKPSIGSSSNNWTDNIRRYIDTSVCSFSVLAKLLIYLGLYATTHKTPSLLCIVPNIDVPIDG